jgi:hypothetical protein
MDEGAKPISDEALIRVLGEYTVKAADTYRRYVSQSAIILAVTLALMFGPALLAAFTVYYLYVRGTRTGVELAAWHLRRIYQLVSRREDIGVRLDSGTRLELELRLSEAAFILTQMHSFDHPEKFAAYRRVGHESPFRILESDDSLLRQPVPTTGPDAPKSGLPA